MQAFDTDNLLRQQQARVEPYLEFLRESTCSAGLYVLPEGGVDGQQPHSEDEIYVVMRGRGVIRVADEDQSVGAGSVVFVAAGVEHRFHSISEELALLVFFAPAEGSQRGAGQLPAGG